MEWMKGIKRIMNFRTNEIRASVVYTSETSGEARLNGIHGYDTKRERHMKQ